MFFTNEFILSTDIRLSSRYNSNGKVNQHNGTTVLGMDLVYSPNRFDSILQVRIAIKHVPFMLPTSNSKGAD
jgi:hypothetical protein